MEIDPFAKGLSGGQCGHNRVNAALKRVITCASIGSMIITPLNEQQQDSKICQELHAFGERRSGELHRNKRNRKRAAFKEVNGGGVARNRAMSKPKPHCRQRASSSDQHKSSSNRSAFSNRGSLHHRLAPRNGSHDAVVRQLAMLAQNHQPVITTKQKNSVKVSNANVGAKGGGPVVISPDEFGRTLKTLRNLQNEVNAAFGCLKDQLVRSNLSTNEIEKVHGDWKVEAAHRQVELESLIIEDEKDFQRGIAMGREFLSSAIEAVSSATAIIQMKLDAEKGIRDAKKEPTQFEMLNSAQKFSLSDIANANNTMIGAGLDHFDGRTVRPNASFLHSPRIIGEGNGNKGFRPYRFPLIVVTPPEEETQPQISSTSDGVQLSEHEQENWNKLPKTMQEILRHCGNVKEICSLSFSPIEDITEEAVVTKTVTIPMQRSLSVQFRDSIAETAAQLHSNFVKFLESTLDAPSSPQD